MSEAKTIEFADLIPSEEVIDSTAPKNVKIVHEDGAVEQVPIQAEKTTGTDLVTVAQGTALVAFSTENGLDPVIKKIKERIASETLDISTEEGRQRIGSLARQIGSAKMRLKEMAQGLTEDWRKKTKSVTSETSRMEKELDALRDSIKEPLEKWKERDDKRKEAHEFDIAAVHGMSAGSWADLTAEDLQGRLDSLAAYRQKDWEEFVLRATDAMDNTETILKDGLTKRVAYDEQQAKLAKLQAEQDERDRLDRERKEAHESALVEISTLSDIGWSEFSAQAIQEKIDQLQPYRQRAWEEFKTTAETAIEAAESFMHSELVARQEYDKGQAELEERRAQDAINAANKEKADKAEQDRKDNHERKIADIVLQANIGKDESSEKIAGRIEALDRGASVAYDWEEFVDKATQANNNTRASLVKAQEAAAQRESAAAEVEANRLKELRAKIADIRALVSFVEPPTIEQVHARIDVLPVYNPAQWKGVEEEAKAAIVEVIPALKKLESEATERHAEKLRQEDEDHRRAINIAAKEAMIKELPQIAGGWTLTPEQAEAVLKLIISKKVPNVSIKY